MKLACPSRGMIDVDTCLELEPWRQASLAGRNHL